MGSLAPAFPLTQLPVYQSTDVEQLNDRLYVVLLIRAQVDSQNQLLSGQVGGPEEYGGPEHWVPFREPSGLPGAVQTWLARRR
jgi:hypothetical protein